MLVRAKCDDILAVSAGCFWLSLEHQIQSNKYAHLKECQAGVRGCTADLRNDITLEELKAKLPPHCLPVLHPHQHLTVSHAFHSSHQVRAPVKDARSHPGPGPLICVLSHPFCDGSTALIEGCHQDPHGSSASKFMPTTKSCGQPQTVSPSLQPPPHLSLLLGLGLCLIFVIVLIACCKLVDRMLLVVEVAAITTCRVHCVSAL